MTEHLLSKWTNAFVHFMRLNDVAGERTEKREGQRLVGQQLNRVQIVIL